MSNTFKGKYAIRSGKKISYRSNFTKAKKVALRLYQKSHKPVVILKGRRRIAFIAPLKRQQRAA